LAVFENKEFHAAIGFSFASQRARSTWEEQSHDYPNPAGYLLRNTPRIASAM
jgi:hypothetical protein